MLEDEGHMIGANHLPECLRDRMAQAPIAVVEDPFELRLERLREEYFTHMHRDFTAAFGEEKGWEEYSAYLHHGLFAIRLMRRWLNSSAAVQPRHTLPGWCRCSTSITTRCTAISWKRKPAKSSSAVRLKTWCTGCQRTLKP